MGIEEEHEEENLAHQPIEWIILTLSPTVHQWGHKVASLLDEKLSPRPHLGDEVEML